MDLKINKWTGKYASIFRVAGKKGDCCTLGQRYPAVLTAPKTGHLTIASNNLWKGNWWKNVKVSTGEWFRIDIWQKKNEKVLTFRKADKFGPNSIFCHAFQGDLMYKVMVDGEERVKPVKIEGQGAKGYKNAQVYLGDPYLPAAGAKVKNLIVGDCVHDVVFY